VFAWHKQSMEGRKHVENEGHDHRPRTSVTENNIRRVQQVLEGDRRLTVAEIAGEVGISYGSTFAIITDKLGFRKVCTRWVPRLLTPEQKLHRTQVCQRLLAKCQEEHDSFLTHIISCDETWVHHYTLNQNEQAWSGERGSPDR
jgi:hypothetical protein